MAFFRRKKSEEEIQKSSISGRNVDTSAKKPLRRKTKEETTKPWGKKERLVVLFVFVGTIIASGVLAASARSWKFPGFPRLQMPKLSFFEGETIILEISKAGVGRKAEEIVENFKGQTKELSGVYGLYVVDLESGFAFGINEKEIFQAASLIKLPAMIAMYGEADEGNIDLDENYSLKNSDKILGSGSLFGKPEGTLLTYRQLIKLMGQSSDNTAFNIVIDLLGEDKIQKKAHEIGMTHTSFGENETTPEDIGIFFRKLWQGDLIDSKSTDELVGYLTDTIYEEWLAVGIPSSVQIAHKYGRETNVVNDAGIVFANNPFVVVITSKGVVGREADEIFPKVSRAIYEIMAN